MNKEDFGKQHKTTDGALVVPLGYYWFGAIRCLVQTVGRNDLSGAGNDLIQYHLRSDLTLAVEEDRFTP